MSQVSGGQSATAQYVPQGSSFYAGNTINGVVTIVSPSTNVNGLIIRVGRFEHYSTSGITALYADTGAPTGLNDFSKRVLLQLDGGSLYGDKVDNLFIPAGRGVFLVGNTGNGQANLNYDLL